MSAVGMIIKIEGVIYFSLEDHVLEKLHVKKPNIQGNTHSGIL